MRYARISDGVVVEIWSPPDGATTPAAAFHPSLASSFVECGPDIAPGHLYEDGEFTTPLDPSPTPQDLARYAEDKRWRLETGGIVVGGVSIATDDRSKQMIIGARIAADADPDWTTQWIAADGSVHPIDAATIIAISDAVQAHVNACFVTYAGVKADIDSGVITTTADIDAAFAA